MSSSNVDHVRVPSSENDVAPVSTSAADGNMVVAAEGPSGYSLLDRASRTNVNGSLRPTTKLFDYSKKVSTTVMINLASIMERTDEQLLPSVYKYVACSFNANLEQLGYVTMARAIFQALASPLGGLLGHYFDRVHVISWGCFIWGVMSFMFSFTHTWTWGALTWAWNGIGLSFVIPNSQSLVADYYDDTERGKAFGTLAFTGAVGGMLGTAFATNMAGHTIWSMEGWRFVFRIVALQAILIGAATLAFAKDPTLKGGHHVPPAHDHKFSFKQTAKEFSQVLRVRTFQIIILQGILGSTPWNALVFMTLYLLLLGFTNLGASVVLTVFLAGAALGSLVGGAIGDWAAQISPNHGRIAVCQFSVFCGVPFTLIILKGLPQSHTDTTPMVVLYSVMMFAFGVMHTWAGPACNNPIFAEIVPTNLRSMVYAFDRSFEGAIASLGAPMVGIVAKNLFGFPVGESYTCVNGLPQDSSDGVAERSKMADALGSAMLVCMIVPWTLCFFIYSGLHWTYPDDRRRAEELEDEDPEIPEVDDIDVLLDGSGNEGRASCESCRMEVLWADPVK